MTYLLSQLWHQKWNEVLITDLACSFSKHFSMIQLCKFQYMFTTTLYWLIMTNCVQIFVQYPAVRHSSNSGQTPRQLQRLCVHLMNMSHLVIILCSPNRMCIYFKSESNKFKIFVFRERLPETSRLWYYEVIYKSNCFNWVVSFRSMLERFYCSEFWFYLSYSDWV